MTVAILLLGVAGTWWIIGGALMVLWAVFEAIRQTFGGTGITLEDDD